MQKFFHGVPLLNSTGPVMPLGMVRHAVIDQRTGEHDISRSVDGIVRDNGGHGLSVNLENHLLGSPENTIIMET
jgi:hypothetical protein